MLLLLLLVRFPAKAQSDIQEKIDSLESFLKENPSRVFINYDIAELYRRKDTALAFQNVRKGLEAAIKENNLYGVGKGKFLLGELYMDYNDPVKGEYFYRAADTVLSDLIRKDSSEENLRLWVRANFNVGVARSHQGINEDIYYLSKISPVAEKIGYYEILAKANTNIAITFYNALQLPKAHEYFEIAAPQHIKANDYTSLVTNRLLFSSLLLQMDSLATAKVELEAVKPVLDSIGSELEKRQLHQTILAEYHIKKEEYKQAIASLERAEAYSKQGVVKSNQLPLYMTFMKVYRILGDSKKGLQYSNMSLELAQQYENRSIEAEIYKEKAYHQDKLGLHKEALESLATYVAISDTINSSELEKEINRLESQYQSEKKEREILQLKNENDTVALELANKQSQNYFLFSVSMGLLVLALFAFMGYRNFKKQDELKAAEISTLKYEQESKVYNAMLEGQENERKRLAVDLHDGLAGRLSATRLKLEKLASKSEVKSHAKGVNEAVSNIDASLTELRSIAMNLMPETLFKYGLKNAVEDYCSSIGGAAKDLKFIIQFYDSEVILPENTNLTIYRIVQELINNAVKHSKATEVLVQYLVEDNRINITVEDNGQGFSKEKADKKGGMGLGNLRNRVAYLNGEIDFVSSPEEGTTVHIVINI
ncbi:MAG: sensor histidine kinase [Bacteroidota bacterium]